MFLCLPIPVDLILFILSRVTFFDISLTIEDFKFSSLIDTGAAVTALGAKVWDKYLSRKDCCLDSLL